MLFIVNRNNAISIIRTNSLIGTNFFLSGTGLFGLARMYCTTFSMRPITIVALQESEENVRYIMDSVINTETSIIEETGLDLTRGKAQVEIIRSQFDTKMPNC